jgi:hypothetical protein
MTTENRSGPFGTGTQQSVEPYAQSNVPTNSDNSLAPPVADGTLARWIPSDLGGEGVATGTGSPRSRA